MRFRDIGFLCLPIGGDTELEVVPVHREPFVSQAGDFGIVGCPLDAAPLESLLIRLFDRSQ
jgi:hypothetical protein